MKWMLREFWEDFGWVGVICFVALFVAIPVAAYVSYQEETNWQRFALDHKCKLVEKGAASAIPVFGGKDTQIAYVPGHDVYLCDDGVRYQR